MARNAAAALSIRRALLEAGCDVAVSVTVLSPALALAALAARIPHVWWLHEFGVQDHGFVFFFGERTTRRLVGWSSRIVAANSLALRDDLARTISRRKLAVVSNPVTIPPGNPLSPSRTPDLLEIAHLGGPNRSKGLHVLLQALAMIPRHKKVRLRCYGKGNPAAERENREAAAALGISDRVEFCGWTDDPVAAVDAAQVVAVTSRQEAFGRVTSLALRRARPVVAFRSGATPELVVHGKNGLLVEPGDVVALSKALERLHDEPRLLADLSRSAVRLMEGRFRPEDVASSIESAVFSALGRRGVAT